MDDVRAQSRHRAVRLRRPEVELIQAGLLLILTFGLVMAGAVAALQARDWYWFSGFVVAELAVVLVYVNAVGALLDWLDDPVYRSVDESVDGSVCCDYDGKHRDHHHPGED